jgi:hypothetical protein
MRKGKMMAARYYKMNDDVEVPGRWSLTRPIDKHGTSLEKVLCRGRPLQVDGPVTLRFNKFAKERGNPVDYSELSFVTVPVVHVRVAEVFAQLAPSDVQIFPARIEGYPDSFCIVNVACEIECIDDKACRLARRYTPEDGKEFTQFIGTYMDVRGLRIDKSKVGNAKVFRPWGWPVVIIVHEEIKEALERIGTAGVRFEEV